MTPGIVGESDLAGNLKTEYVFFAGRRVARKDLPAGAVSYYFSDHLKTASVVTDATGTLLDESDYYPWGGELQFVNNLDNHYKFTGKERDSESGLDYFGARYYSNGLGRFVSADWSATPEAVPYADFGDPQSLNLFTYVRNIPTTKIDADGHFVLAGQQQECTWWCRTKQRWHNLKKYGVGALDADLEEALKRRADQARKNLTQMKNLTIGGKTPQEIAANGTNQQAVDAEQAVANFGLSKLQFPVQCPEGMECGIAIPVGLAAAEEGAASEYINVTRGASVNNIQTNVTASEFGANLEANGFVKSTAADGTPTYTKGATQYTVYNSRSTGGPTAQVKISGEVIGKIRLQ